MTSTCQAARDIDVLTSTLPLPGFGVFQFSSKC